MYSRTRPFTYAIALLSLLTTTSLRPVLAQEPVAKTEATAPRSKSGKKLFGTAEALRIARVSSPRISPDGARVAYLVAENQMDKKDEPWKSVTQLWVVPTAGPPTAARQFTRGEKSVSNPAWSPDGKLLAFTMDAGDEKDAKPQVWFMYADGGEAWQVTKHKSGVRGFEFSPDSKSLLLLATSPPSDNEEKRNKEKDDAVVVDHDLKMAQLWTWNITTSEEKQITKGDFSVSDPRWSPDGMRITFTTTPTPRADDSSPQYTHMARWSHDGKWIAFLGRSGFDIYKTNLLVVGADGGQPREMTSSFELYAGEPFWSRDGKTIFFTANIRESLEVFATDVARGTARQVTDKLGVIDLTGISDAGEAAVGTWSDPTHPNDVFRSNVSFTSIEPVTNQNAWLSDYALGETEVVRWKSSR